MAMTRAYYNEYDDFAADWLEQLIHARVIADGDVDRRNIWDVCPSDLEGYTQCHFFAGIGGWAYALRLAGWPDDRAVWTGSCPCQPFSAAGRGRGFADERHAWPAWFEFIDYWRPAVIMGEQVDRALDWLDLVSADLEGAGYACEAADLPAASVGAPHRRQRLWFVAERLADAQCLGTRPRRFAGQPGESVGAAPTRPPVESGRCGVSGELGDPDHTRPQGLDQRRHSPDQWVAGATGLVDIAMGIPHSTRETPLRGFPNGPIPERERSPWAVADWLSCRDGVARPVEPGTFPLAHGISQRMGRLRGYGNAIVPQVAAEVIRAYLAALESRDRVAAGVVTHEEIIEWPK